MKRLILLVAFAIAIQSCKKEKVWDNKSADDNSTAETYFNDLFKTVDDLAGATEGIREYEMGCIDTVIVDTVSNPMSLLIDFGQDNCIGADGRYRKGQIFVTFTGRYREPGTVITITPIDYTVNGYLLEGTKQVTNMGLNGNGEMYFEIAVDGSITAPNNAYTVEWQSDRIRTWKEGQNSITIWDDVYEITGNGSGINRNGDPFTVQITTALQVEIGCPWIVSGALELIPDDGATRFVDFGNGNCNNGFTVTVNGQVYQFGTEG